jgi:hypothetical protein
MLKRHFDFTGFDERFIQSASRAERKLPTVRSLKVGILDHHNRRVRVAFGFAGIERRRGRWRDERDELTEIARKEDEQKNNERRDPGDQRQIFSHDWL